MSFRVSSRLFSAGLLATTFSFSSTVFAINWPAGLNEERITGLQALELIEDQLSEIAAAHKMSEGDLRRQLANDASLWIDRSGRLLYIDGGESYETPAQSEPADTADAPLFPLEQTFQLNSKPGSSKVIYLDFDGHEAVDTAWSGGSGTITARPWDFTGDRSVFDDAERERIQLIWQRVANDFAPFDVNVTTQDPGDDRILRNSGGDQDYGTRLVFTDDTFLDCGCGGVAYVGVFGWSSSSRPGYYQPAWAFNKGRNGVYEAETASHEIGHNLGLGHDGIQNGTGYYGGHGSGATSWGPIMGVGWNRNLSQWSKGEYPNASNQQDDIAVIENHGALLRVDDYPFDFPGSAISDVAILGGSQSGQNFSIDQDGLIEQQSDVDSFRFTTMGGPVLIQAEPAGVGTNLDLALELRDYEGQLVQSANDDSDLSAAIDMNLAAGIYVLSVTGTGDQSPAPGYSDYGSLGHYRIAGEFEVPENSADVQMSVADRNVQESAANAVFKVSLSAPGEQPIAVNYRTEPGTAESGVDYQSANGQLLFQPGEVSQYIRVPLINDSLDEENENFSVVLEQVVGATIVDGTATGKIIDEDQPTAKVSISREKLTIREAGDRTVASATLSAVSGRSVRVHFKYGGTATRNADFTAPLYVDIPAGQTRVDFYIQAKQDEIREPAQYLDMRINYVERALIEITQRRQVIRIADDDLL